MANITLYLTNDLASCGIVAYYNMLYFIRTAAWFLSITLSRCQQYRELENSPGSPTTTHQHISFQESNKLNLASRIGLVPLMIDCFPTNPSHSLFIPFIIYNNHYVCSHSGYITHNPKTPPSRGAGLRPDFSWLVQRGQYQGETKQVFKKMIQWQYACFWPISRPLPPAN